MQAFGEQVVALLDHLGVDEAVIAGTSLGANTALEVLSLAPERIRGMVIEMPVLDNAILGARGAFLPFMLAMHVRRAGAARRERRREPHADLARPAIDMLMDLPARPAGSSLAVLQRPVLRPHRPADRGAPHDRGAGARRRPPNDPIHPLTDSDELARELPNARLVAAESIVEMRVRPGAADGGDRGVRGPVLGRLAEAGARQAARAAKPRARKRSAA